MSCGIAYDSDEAAPSAARSRIMTGRAYAARRDRRKLGAFPGHAPNAKAMLRVIRNHKRAADGLADATSSFRSPRPARPSFARKGGRRVATSWPRRARPGPTRSRSAKPRLSQRAGLVVAPTGTIGLVMDCDTTGIEPDFALVKFKSSPARLFKIINRRARALRALGYGEARIAEIVAYAVATPRSPVARRQRRQPARQGFTDAS